MGVGARSVRGVDGSPTPIMLLMTKHPLRIDRPRTSAEAHPTSAEALTFPKGTAERRELVRACTYVCVCT